MDFLTLNPVGLLSRVFHGIKRPERYAPSVEIEPPTAPGPGSLWNYYQSRIKTSTDRLEAYRDYEEMDASDLCASIFDCVAEDCTQPDTISGRSLWISSENEELRGFLTDFIDSLEIEERTPSRIRETAKYGDCFERVWYKYGEGVQALEYYPPSRVFPVVDKGRKRGYTIDTSVDVQGNSVIYNPWDFLQASRLVGRMKPNEFLGDSWARPARRIWKKLQMVEDAIILYRLKMAPDRFLYMIDVGESSATEAMDIVRMWRRALKRNVLYNPVQRSLREEYNMWSQDEDIFFPTKEGSQSRVEKLPGSGNTLGECQDYELLVLRFFAAMRAPPAYFGMRGESGAVIDNGKTLGRQDVRWSRGCRSTQKAETKAIARLCQIHMALKGIDPTDPANQFEVCMAPVSYLDEMERLEVFDMRSRAIDAISRVLSDVEGLDKKKWVSWLLWKFGGLSKNFIKDFIDKTAGGDQNRTASLEIGGPLEPGQPILGMEGEELTPTEQEHLERALGPDFLRQIRVLSENGLDGNTRSDTVLNELLPSCGG